ncbi:hypothetical protein QAD02_008492 [Eretmocerus hayati]|uniref:Uncharacterized protein n=1 Tax=Eretmocerus hayati TaxID=131215 RepID=A0ACC2N6L2_9HYME|nr:hypothetical protein QAD02_008492 [Eretmocerus hayati]
MANAQLDDLAVNNFREYLKIPTVHPDVQYGDCVKFLEAQAKSLDLPIKVHYVVPNRPVVIITWIGNNPSLPSVLLNSHMDVVPVFADQWEHPPFDAHMDDKGNIYARGSQDMKCVGSQYLEAIRRLKLNGLKLKRTIHMSFVPEEETGGSPGMKEFCKTKEFSELNVGFALDEGIANPTESFSLFNGERSIWQIVVHLPGSTGHGSMLLDNTPGEKLRFIIDKFMDFRSTQKTKLLNPNVKLGNVTSVNLTKIHGGVKTNVIPNMITAVFDCRIDPDTKHEDFEEMLKKWCREAGEGVHYSFEEKNKYVENTKLDESNPFWLAFKNSCDEQKLKLDIGIFPGGTDSRYIRDLGIPAIGFSPMNNTKILLHDHNEYLNKDVYLKGITIYTKLICAVADV